MSVKVLQTKIGAVPDGIFGPATFYKAMEYFDFTPLRAAHFFGQCDHETGGFKWFTENLNYPASRLLKVFKKYFDEKQSMQYAFDPERIANRVYANRMGNGDEASGDGWKYRGRGAIQLTGKENYRNFAEWIEKPTLLVKPELVATDYAFESALYFFNSKKLWVICDTGVDELTIKKVTRAINGGTNGLGDRIEKTLKYYRYVQSI